jgi:hypothetical protein
VKRAVLAAFVVAAVIAPFVLSGQRDERRRPAPSAAPSVAPSADGGFEAFEPGRTQIRVPIYGERRP